MKAQKIAPPITDAERLAHMQGAIDPQPPVPEPAKPDAKKPAKASAPKPKGQGKPAAAPWDNLEDAPNTPSTLRFSARHNAMIQWVIKSAPDSPRSKQKIVDDALEEYLSKKIGEHWKPA